MLDRSGEARLLRWASTDGRQLSLEPEELKAELKARDPPTPTPHLPPHLTTPYTSLPRPHLP